MKEIRFTIICLALSVVSLSAQENCLEPAKLKNLDAAWEKAQLELDLGFIDSLLAEEFIWVHNHASLIDDKPAVVERVKRALSRDSRNTRSRNSEEVKVIIYGSTGIVNGFTTVDRGPTPTKYNFMRTYVQADGKCYLLANHTMAVPEEEKD